MAIPHQSTVSIFTHGIGFIARCYSARAAHKFSLYGPPEHFMARRITLWPAVATLWPARSLYSPLYFMARNGKTLTAKCFFNFASSSVLARF